MFILPNIVRSCDIDYTTEMATKDEEFNDYFKPASKCSDVRDCHNCILSNCTWVEESNSCGT